MSQFDAESRRIENGHAPVFHQRFDGVLGHASPMAAILRASDRAPVLQISG